MKYISLKYLGAEELNRRRDEILKSYGLDEESIREFRKDIKQIDISLANDLAKDMFSKKFVGYKVSDDYLQRIKDGANVNYGTGDYDNDIPLILKSVSTSFYEPINIDIFLNLIRAGAEVDVHGSGITPFIRLVRRIPFYMFEDESFELLKLIYLIGADVWIDQEELNYAGEKFDEFVKDAQEYEKKNPDNYQNRQLKYPQVFQQSNNQILNNNVEEKSSEINPSEEKTLQELIEEINIKVKRIMQR